MEPVVREVCLRSIDQVDSVLNFLGSFIADSTIVTGGVARKEGGKGVKGEVRMMSQICDYRQLGKSWRISLELLVCRKRMKQIFEVGMNKA